MQTNAKEIIERSDRMFSRRASTDALRQEIALQFAPDLATFTTTPYEGEDFGAHLLEISGMLYGRDFVGAKGALLRPSGKRWARVTTDDEDALSTESKRFFEYISRVTWAMVTEKRAQFARAAPMMDRHIGFFGENCMTIEERGDPNDPGLLFRSWHPKNVAFEDNQFGEACNPVRRFEITASAYCKMFKAMPDAHPHPDVERIAEKEPQKKIRIRHAIIGMEDYDYQYGKKTKGLPFASIYIDVENCHVIRERPARFDPYVISRWQMRDDIPDGFSPAAMAALPVSRRSQEIALSLLENAQKQAEPPLIATAAAIINGEINMGAGQVTYIDREYDERQGDPLRPLDIGGDMRVALEVQRDTRQALEMAFFINKLALPNERPKTAYESSLIFQEMVRSQLPIFEPLEQEENTRIFDKVVEIGMQVGAYGPLQEIMPKELDGAEIRFQFENPLRDAIDGEKVVEFEKILQMAGAAAQIDPESIAEINIKRALRDAASTTHHNEWILSEREVQARIAEMQQKQQAMMQMEALKSAGTAAKDFAKAGQDAGPMLEQLAANG